MALGNLVPWRRKSSVPARRDDGPANDPFMALQREMNRLFEDFNHGFDLAPFGGSEGWAPKVNVSESDKEIRISAELPGMDEKDIDVTVSRESVTLRGEKVQEKEEKDRNFFRSERVYGSFHREIPIPAEVETDKVDARFKKGVLEIVLPKSQKAQQEVKKIEVKKE